MMSSATSVTYARLAQARLMPSHFSGVAMMTSAHSSEAMSGVKSPEQAHASVRRSQAPDFQAGADAHVSACPAGDAGHEAWMPG